MQFFFLNSDETLIGIQNNAQVCKVNEANYTASFSFEMTSDFSFDDVYYVGFHDIDNNLVFYEVRDLKYSSTAKGIVSIEAEHAAFAELIDEVVEGKAVRGATAGYAISHVLDGSRWHVVSAETTPTMSTTFYYKNKWECFESIAKATDCAFYFNWTVYGNTISDRQVIVKARQGAARGKRFDLTKDLTSISIVEDRSSVYTKLYGRGKGEEVTSDSGQTAYGRRLDFGDVVWSIASGDPINKPAGQKYIEDVNATQMLGRGASAAKRAREAVITFEECEDAEELLQLTYAKLLKVRYPKLTITGKVIDLERAWGYQHEAVRLGDDVLVIADEWNATYHDKVVGLIRDYLNEFNTEVTIGEEGQTSYSLASKLSTEFESVKEKADIGSALAAVNPNLLQGVLDTMATRIVSTGTGITTDPNDGSLVLTANDGSSAVKITGNGIMISNSNIGGAWQWRTALSGDGVVTSTLAAGVINAAIIKILGTDQFYWDASNIYIKNPDDTDQQIRIGLYNGVDYGIGYTVDGGVTWQNAIGFDGVHFATSDIAQAVLDSEELQERLDGKADMADVDDELFSLKTELLSSIEQTKSSMLMRVSEIYTTSNSMEEFKSQISTLFQQTSNSIDMYFSTVESRVTALDDTVSTSISNQNQYIRFIDGDIYLGEVGNPLILKITNNRISFYSNNVEIAYFSSGRLYVDQLEAITSLTLGSYAFLPNKTGGMTLKYIGT